MGPSPVVLRDCLVEWAFFPSEEGSVEGSMPEGFAATLVAGAAVATIHTFRCAAAEGALVAAGGFSLAWAWIAVEPPEEMTREDACAYFVALPPWTDDPGLALAFGLWGVPTVPAEIAVERGPSLTMPTGITRTGQATIRGDGVSVVLDTAVDEASARTVSTLQGARSPSCVRSDERAFVVEPDPDGGRPRVVAAYDFASDEEAGGEARHARGGAAAEVGGLAPWFPCERCAGSGTHSWGAGRALVLSAVDLAAN